MKNIKIIFLSISIFILWIGIFCWSPVFATDSMTNYINTINNNLNKAYNTTSNNKNNIQRIMAELCKSIYTITDYQEWDIIYDPRQSIFIDITCSSFTWSRQNEINTSKWKDKTIGLIIKEKRWDWYWLWLYCPTGQNVVQQNTTCTTITGNNSIDYNFLFLQTIKYVLNDRTNIATARLYGLQDSTAEWQKDLANEYLWRYYKILWNTPEAKDYPKTHKQLMNYIKNAKDLIKKLYIIDVQKLKKEDNKNKIKENRYELKQNMTLRIGWKDYGKNVWFTQDYADQQAIVNMMYNELFFYTLFASSYEQYIRDIMNDPKNRDKIPSLELLNISNQWENNYGIFLQNQSINNRKKTQLTVQQTLRKLFSLQSSFPIHIWFLLYQEDLYNFRKVLSNIYLPFHQLHYKLENVQSKD